jgi:hypothetical protein
MVAVQAVYQAARRIESTSVVYHLLIHFFKAFDMNEKRRWRQFVPIYPEVIKHSFIERTRVGCNCKFRNKTSFVIIFQRFN